MRGTQPLDSLSARLSEMWLSMLLRAVGSDIAVDGELSFWT